MVAPLAIATTPVSPVLELIAAAMAIALAAALLEDAKVLLFVSEAAEEPFLRQVMIRVKFVCFSILFAQRNKYVSSIQVILQE